VLPQSHAGGPKKGTGPGCASARPIAAAAAPARGLIDGSEIESLAESDRGSGLPSGLTRSAQVVASDPAGRSPCDGGMPARVASTEAAPPGLRVFRQPLTVTL